MEIECRSTFAESFWNWHSRWGWSRKGCRPIGRRRRRRSCQLWFQNEGGWGPWVRRVEVRKKRTEERKRLDILMTKTKLSHQYVASYISHKTMSLCLESMSSFLNVSVLFISPTRWRHFLFFSRLLSGTHLVKRSSAWYLTGRRRSAMLSSG